MAKFREKNKAIKLRKAGQSYSQIKQALGVSKGTLSVWLKGLPLSEERIRELRDWSEKRIEHYRETRRRKREAIFGEAYKRERKVILPLSPRDVFIAGLFLYWGEGAKTRLSQLSLSNSNPAVIKSFIAWLGLALGVNRSGVSIKLHLYSDMDTQREMRFWSKALDVPISQFKKPYIKTSKLSSLTYKNGFGHGTCNAEVGNAIVGRKIFAGLKVIENYFNGPVA